jgi:hypothetical protein
MFLSSSDAQMEQLFPDELDTPKDIPARLRFQKYRGLKSFRTSPWDPKENLPSEYARIFQFENFDHTCKKIMKGEDKEGVMVCIMNETNMKLAIMAFCIVLVSLHSEFSAGLNLLKFCQNQMHFDDIYCKLVVLIYFMMQCINYGF